MAQPFCYLEDFPHNIVLGGKCFSSVFCFFLPFFLHSQFPFSVLPLPHLSLTRLSLFFSVSSLFPVVGVILRFRIPCPRLPHCFGFSLALHLIPVSCHLLHLCFSPSFTFRFFICKSVSSTSHPSIFDW